MIAAARWRQRLEYSQVTRVVFAGGALKFDTPPSYRSDDGVSYIALDYVAVISGGLLYRIPFRALRKVSGRRQDERNQHVNVYLHTQVSQWVDPSVNPDDPDEIVWHTFIDRNGMEHRGAILQVSRISGIWLRLKKGQMMRLRWNQVGAATEILE